MRLRRQPKVEYKDLLLAESPTELEHLLREYLEAHPNDIWAYLKLGNLLREKGEPQKALRLHQTLLAKPKLDRTTKVKVLKAIARDYIELGKTEAAAKTYEQMVSIIPERSAYEELLRLYESVGDWDKAIDVKNKLLRLDKKPEDRHLAILYTMKAYSLADEMPAKEREAEKYLKMAEKIYPDSPLILYVRGELHMKSGRNELAVDAWRQLLMEHTDYAYLVLDKLEDLLFKQGRFSELELIYEDTLKIARNPHVIAHLIHILLSKGEKSRAMEYLDELISSYGESDGLRSLKYLLHIEVNDLETVRDELQVRGSPFLPYKCENCGYESTMSLMQCPNCRSWLSFR